MRARMISMVLGMGLSSAAWGVTYECGVVENKENGAVLGRMTVDTNVEQAQYVQVSGGKVIALCTGVKDSENGASYLGCGQMIMEAGMDASTIRLQAPRAGVKQQGAWLALGIVPEDAGFVYVASDLPAPGHVVICGAK